jgi:salicylate hydroxylase
MVQQKPFQVAVCGGGIGGLCLAIGLLRQKVSCKIYEAAAEFSEIGAGVSFGPNAVRAMKLIDPKIADSFEKCWTVNGSSEKKETWFDFSTGQDQWTRGGEPAAVGTHVANVTAGEIGQNSVHRAHFLAQLIKLIPADVAEFGKRVKDITEKDGKMVMTFEDDTSAEADAIVGCDGIKSRTRKILLGDNHEASSAVFSGKYAYRGLIPMDTAVESLGDELARNSQMYMGNHGHVLTFPIEKGKTMNVVAFQSKPNEKWDNDKWIVSSTREEMLADFEGWGENVTSIVSVSLITVPREKLIELTNLKLMQRFDVWALFDHPPAPTYYKGRLCLLGDAAHASTPHQGAGAGQAVEDAFILSNLLGQITGVADVEKAFQAYDSVRRLRSQRVVTTSREAGRLYEMEDEEAGSDLDRAQAKLLARYAWIWEIDLDAHLEEALRLL